MKNLAMLLMGVSLMTLLSFNIPVSEQETEQYLPIDTTLEGMEDLKTESIDFDSETF
jgi:hypothetical protein